MTDVEIYDRAVRDYLLEVHPRVVYATTDKAEYIITKDPTYKDDIPYNFISFYRDLSFEIDMSRYNTETLRGYLLSVRGDRQATPRSSVYVQSVPVNLSYQVDIWAATSTAVLEISQKLVLKLNVLNPVLFVPINPEGENGRFHILNIEWVDNTDLESEVEKGRLYRHTFRFTIDARIKNIVQLESEKFQCPNLDIEE